MFANTMAMQTCVHLKCQNFFIAHSNKNCHTIFQFGHIHSYTECLTNATAMQTTVLLEAIPFGNYQSTNWIDGTIPTLMKRFLVVIWSHLAPIFMNETRSDGS